MSVAIFFVRVAYTVIISFLMKTFEVVFISLGGVEKSWNFWLKEGERKSNTDHP